MRAIRHAPADAKQAALAVLESRTPSERAQVISLGSQLQVLTQTTQDPGALRAAVESIVPGDTRLPVLVNWAGLFAPWLKVYRRPLPQLPSVQRSEENCGDASEFR